MVKKILLTIGALPAGALLTFIVILITEILGILFGKNLWVTYSYFFGSVAVILPIIIFIFLAYLIWKNFWQTVFVFCLPVGILGFSIELAHISSWRVIDTISDIGLVIGLLGLFSYSFKKRLFSKAFWKLFFWIYLLVNIYELLLPVFPQIAANLPKFLVDFNIDYNPANIVASSFIGLLVEIPLLLAAYHLAYKK